MDKHSIHPGRHYAVRERPHDELHRVKILEAVRQGKWRAEWIDPNPGLIDYVASRHIIVEWKDVRAFRRDERNQARMADHVEHSSFPGERHPLCGAVDEVLDATGEPSIYVHHGVMGFEPDALERVAARAQIPTPDHPVGYVDRHDDHFLPWDCALDLAEAFARHEPSTVLDPIDAHERELSIASKEPGGSHLIRMLTEYRARWAIVRQWAGYDAAIEHREQRIADLERLLTSIMWELRRPAANCELLANRIDRALRRG